MNARFCTVEGDSEDAAREAGAAELGVLPEDVSVQPLKGDTYRVELARAPATIEVTVRGGEMEALVTTITPALGDHPRPTRQSVEEALLAIGVTAGLLPEEIDEMVAAVAESGCERHNVTVARGTPPRDGAAARVTRHYLRPTAQDPRRRRLVVRAGELLAQREPATAGEDGSTVTGRALPATPGAEEEVPYGPGVAMDERGLRWTASVPVLGYLEIAATGELRVVPAVAVSADHLQATLDLRSPGADEPPITRAELDAAIRAAGVVHGLSPRRVEEAWRNFLGAGRLPRTACIAEGDAPRPGRDAGIEFALEVGQRVGELDPGVERLDFRERHLVHNVHAGQAIGTWSPDGAGVPGLGVDATELPAAPGEPGACAAGENVVTEELGDGRILLSSLIDGMLVLSDKGVPSVQVLLEVGGDVGYDTGSIDAEGCVVVRGSVLSEFRVTAVHDITVLGSIEDAFVHAGGTLEVHGGVLGGEHGRASAGSLVSVRFAQNAHIACDGDVEILESETNSVIECRGRLRAGGPRGRLRGGRYSASRGLEARELGSELGAPTVVTVGVDADLLRALARVRAEMRANRARGCKAQRSAAAARERALALRRHVKAKREQLSAEAALRARLAQLEAELHRDDPPAVEVSGAVHAGVHITINGAHLSIDEPEAHVRYTYDPESGQIRKGSL